MINTNRAQQVADAWVWVMDRTRDPFRHDWMFNLFRKSYRERLDEPVINYKGEVVPRIEVVRLNLSTQPRIRRPLPIPN